MQSGHLVMREETLRTTPLRHPKRALLRVLHHDALEDRRNAMAHPPVQPLVAEVLDRPILHRLHDERVRGRRENRRLLRAELQDRRALRRAADLAAERVERADGRVGLREGQREAGERDGADGDALDDGHEVRVDVGGLVEAAEQGAAREAHVAERGEGVRDGVRATTRRQQSEIEWSGPLHIGDEEGGRLTCTGRRCTSACRR